MKEKFASKKTGHSSGKHAAKHLTKYSSRRTSEGPNGARLSAQTDHIFGVRPIHHCLEVCPHVITKLWVERGRTGLEDVVRIAGRQQISTESVGHDFFERFGDSNHQGIAAMIKPIVPAGASDLLVKVQKHIDASQPVTLLVLDGIQDPHNFGAIIRTADAAGVIAILIPTRNSVGITASVIKVSSGAAFSLPVFSTNNLVRTLQQLQQIGVWFSVLDGAADTSIYQHDWQGNVGIIMGSEATGCRHQIREIADYLVSIPMCGAMSSLNVSVAAGVVLYHAMSQR